MIARIWRGATREELADEYVDYLRQTGLKEYKRTPGNRGAYILRRALGDGVEFVTLSFWDSEESIRAFAGEDIAKAVFYPEDDRFLVAREPTAEHYEVFD